MGSTIYATAQGLAPLKSIIAYTQQLRFFSIYIIFHDCPWPNLLLKWTCCVSIPFWIVVTCKKSNKLFCFYLLSILGCYVVRAPSHCEYKRGRQCRLHESMTDFVITKTEEFHKSLHGLLDEFLNTCRDVGWLSTCENVNVIKIYITKIKFQLSWPDDVKPTVLK